MIGLNFKKVTPNRPPPTLTFVAAYAILHKEHSA